MSVWKWECGNLCPGKNFFGGVYFLPTSPAPSTLKLGSSKYLVQHFSLGGGEWKGVTDLPYCKRYPTSIACTSMHL